MFKRSFLLVIPILLLGIYIFLNPIKATNNNFMQKKAHDEIINTLEQFNVEKFISRVEKYTNQTNINVYKIKHLFDKVEFELHGEIEGLLEFLNILENKEALVQIRSIQMDINKIKLNLDIGKKLNRYQVSNDRKNIQNPFIFNIPNQEFTLLAIIENSAIIDKNLVQVGDVFKTYRVYKIEDKSVVLRNKEKQIILRIDDV